MSQEERYNRRDMSYSAWHRRNSTRRFIGIEDAQLLAMIDIDVSVYIEYDDNTKEPLALVETAVDVGQDFKNARVTLNLAKRADLPCYVVLYKLSDRPNPAAPELPDIEQFKVKRLYPNPTPKWYTLSPERWARHLLEIRRRVARKLDREYADTARELAQ